ncbi:MAG: CoA transferase, partial [Pseudomonadota bacterium]
MIQNSVQSTRHDATSGPLNGVRVLDLTSVVLGPSATQALGDMGADVIKVEGPEGDIMRYAEPLKSQGMGGVFMNINRNKRAIGLDLKQDSGRSALMALVKTADVLIHSMRPQAIKKLGLDYEAVKAQKADIIYCATIGFSARGPYAERPAYDDVIQGLSGFADLARARSGGAPEFAPSIICDKIVGLTAYGAVTTALYHRAMTGEGQ